MPSAHRAALDLIERTFRSKPLTFVVGAWIAGIWMADLWSGAPMWPGIAGPLLGLAALGSRRRGLALGLLLLGVAALGCAATRLALTPPRGDVSEWAGKEIAVAGSIADDPAQRCDHWHCIVDCQSVLWSGRSQPVRGNLSVSTSQDLSDYEVGDVVLVYGVPERPSPARNPGGFSSAGWAARHGVFALMAARPGATSRVRTSAWSWRRSAGRWRRRIADCNRAVITDPRTAVLVNSVLFGAHDQEDTGNWGETAERFRRAGVIHVLVVSGAQVALLFGLLGGWRRWMHRLRTRSPRFRHLLSTAGGYSYRQALSAGLALLTIYVPLVGLQPSVVRPTLVVGTFTIGRWLDRETDPENSLAAAALLLLVAHPLTLYDLGFQLSFAAVWGIIRWLGVLSDRLFRVWNRDIGVNGDDSDDHLRAGFLLSLAVVSLAMTLAAQMAVTPLIAQQFQTVSLIAPASNLPIILLATFLLPVGLFTSALNAILVPALGSVPWWLHWVNAPTALLAHTLDVSVTAFARPEWATVPVSPPGWAAVALCAALLLVASLPAVLQRRSRSLALVALAGAVFVGAILLPAPPVGVPTLTFIDVGQGDGCLIRLPGGLTMLVDGGGSPRAPCERRDCADAPVGHLADSIRKDCTDIGRDILASYLRHERVRRIDLMVITHPHDDHLWGLDAILDPRQHFDVGAVLDARMPFDTRANQEWACLLQRRGPRLITARRGMQLALGPARLEVLHPSYPFLTHTRSDPNNNSIVLRLEVGGSRVLLTGDAEREAETAMADADLRADILKVGHHGSAYSSSDAWLDHVQPRIAVVSCGRHNAFGHPSPDTLDRLCRHGVKTYRTDTDGAVTLELHPQGWTAATLLHPPPRQ